MRRYRAGLPSGQAKVPVCAERCRHLYRRPGSMIVSSWFTHMHNGLYLFVMFVGSVMLWLRLRLRA